MSPLHVAFLLAFVAPLAAQQPTLLQGPLIGHTTPRSALVWARADRDGALELVAKGPDGSEHRASATADTQRDRCVVFSLAGLQPGQRYRYRVTDDAGRTLVSGEKFTFRTAPAADADGATRIMFGSCAREDRGTAGTWRSVAEQQPDCVVLLGDTPYIDRTTLAHQRRRYAEFAAFAPMAELLRTTPWYGTWDDHDFGRNDVDGRLRGKADSRRAFVEYHALPGYGDGARGIYTKFRRGPVEVFLLDTRTFAATEPSPFLAHHASLLGSAQWQWLRQGLAESTAPVKVLACGMIWNGATRPGKLDHWGSYPHERDALFRFLGKREIAGVVLVGGDIHRSRVVRHAAEPLAGYDIIELITSPMHGSVIKSANAPHPGLVRDMGEPHSFLLLDVAQKGGARRSARARFLNADGDELFAIDV